MMFRTVSELRRDPIPYIQYGTMARESMGHVDHGTRSPEVFYSFSSFGGRLSLIVQRTALPD